jgi:uncharacterized membrane protein
LSWLEGVFRVAEKDRSAEEIQETNRFIQESTLGTINQIIQEEAIDDPDNVKEPVKELGMSERFARVFKAVDFIGRP